jgi:hypothetical protein
MAKSARVDMGSYFSERWDALSDLPAAFATNPWFFIIAFAIGLPLIWWKWRVAGNNMQLSIDSQTHGWRAGVDKKDVRHETGIGTREVLIMRPAKLPKMIWFSLIFFGGGALFYALVVLQSGNTGSEDWWVFAGLAAFTIGAIAVIEMNQTRIIITDQGIERRKVLTHRQRIEFSQIKDVTAHAKDFGRGLIVHANDGQKMRVLPSMSGYKQLMERLAPYNKKMALMAKLMKTQQTHARTP